MIEPTKFCMYCGTRIKPVQTVCRNCYDDYKEWGKEKWSRDLEASYRKEFETEVLDYEFAVKGVDVLPREYNKLTQEQIEQIKHLCLDKGWGRIKIAKEIDANPEAINQWIKKFKKAAEVDVSSAVDGL